jgi:hypothetical protein
VSSVNRTSRPSIQLIQGFAVMRPSAIIGRKLCESAIPASKTFSAGAGAPYADGCPAAESTNCLRDAATASRGRLSPASAPNRVNVAVSAGTPAMCLGRM